MIRCWHRFDPDAPGDEMLRCRKCHRLIPFGVMLCQLVILSSVYISVILSALLGIGLVWPLITR